MLARKAGTRGRPQHHCCNLPDSQQPGTAPNAVWKANGGEWKRRDENQSTSLSGVEPGEERKSRGRLPLTLLIPWIPSETTVDPLGSRLGAKKRSEEPSAKRQEHATTCPIRDPWRRRLAHDASRQVWWSRTGVMETAAVLGWSYQYVRPAMAPSL